MFQVHKRKNFHGKHDPYNSVNTIILVNSIIYVETGVNSFIYQQRDFPTEFQAKDINNILNSFKVKNLKTHFFFFFTNDEKSISLKIYALSIF